MEYNIFSMFYPLHRTYPNIFTIFGSAHNFLHKIKHNLNLHKKEKEKRHCAAGGPAAWPAGRPICSANALRAPSPPPPHDVADSGPPLSASSLTLPAARLSSRPPLVGFQPSRRSTATSPLLRDPVDPAYGHATPSPYLGHTHGGRRHWPHVDRLRELSRA
jgi:hypothetical protein